MIGEGLFGLAAEGWVLIILAIGQAISVGVGVRGVRKTDEVRHDINSRVDELLAAVAGEQYAAGQEDERNRASGAQRRRPPAPRTTKEGPAP